MKLLRIGTAGHEVPCVLDSAGAARDVSSLIADFTPDTIGTARDILAAADLGALPEVSMTDARIGPPLSEPNNIYCIGLNYSDHAEEAGMAIPEEPILFNKARNAYCGPNDPTLYSPKMTKLDWEVELAFVIGKTALNVPLETALDHVAGYTLANDISERAWQTERAGTWSKGKSFPNFCPTGPFVVTPEEAGDVNNLEMWLDVNGTRMQSGTTAKMIFGVAEIISALSEFMRLEPGDLVLTGTPPGVGMGQTPPRWLVPGDEVTLGIEGLGKQTQVVTPL